MIPIMAESAPGDHVNTTPFYFICVAWARKFHHYELKRGQLSIDLYLNIIKLESRVLFIFYIFYNRLKRLLLLASDTYTVIL